MTHTPYEPRVLAIDPTTNGFGFAVMEGPERLIDWGVKHAGGDDKNGRCLELTSKAIAHYSPDLIVIEDYRNKGSRRCERVRSLLEEINNRASGSLVRVHRITRSDVRKAFAASAASTKHQIAKAIAERLPELGRRLPPYRHPWMPEDYRMSIFDAVALALTFYELRLQKRAQPLSALGINGSDYVQ